MIILTIRTDKPEAELGLYDDKSQLAYEVWPAHRQLAETIHNKISELCLSQNIKLEKVESIVVYRGPGSFTGLRIGISVANALADSLAVPIVSESGEWIEQGINRILAGDNEKITQPEYGGDAHITTQKK